MVGYVPWRYILYVEENEYIYLDHIFHDLYGGGIYE